MVTKKPEKKMVFNTTIVEKKNCLVRFFVWWLIFQMVFIGLVMSFMNRSIDNKTYDCSIESPQISWTAALISGAIFPLAAFIPESLEETGKRLTLCNQN